MDNASIIHQSSLINIWKFYVRETCVQFGELYIFVRHRVFHIYIKLNIIIVHWNFQHFQTERPKQEEYLKLTISLDTVQI